MNGERKRIHVIKDGAAVGLNWDQVALQMRDVHRNGIGEVIQHITHFGVHTAGFLGV